MKCSRFFTIEMIRLLLPSPAFRLLAYLCCIGRTPPQKMKIDAVRQDIEPFGITQIALSELNDILKDLTARKMNGKQNRKRELLARKE